MNKIKLSTRRKLADAFITEQVNWNGRSYQTEFLSRLYDLQSLPSTDYRFKTAGEDIFQHQVRNNDWENDWIFTYPHIDLLNCPDDQLLDFLCETLHPRFRTGLDDSEKLLNLYNSFLELDGYEISETVGAGGTVMYIGQEKLSSTISPVETHARINNYLNSQYVSQQITLMQTNIRDNPHIAIGKAKELIETCCKSILIQKGVQVDSSWDVPKLVKETNKVVNFGMESISDQENAERSIKQVLGGISSTIQGLCELRNSHGDGHGRDASFIGLRPYHARLLVSSSSNLALFYLEVNGEGSPIETN